MARLIVAKTLQMGFKFIPMRADNRGRNLCSHGDEDQMPHERAYSLAFTGLEESAKSQLAADEYDRFIGEQMFGSISKITKEKSSAWSYE